MQMVPCAILKRFLVFHEMCALKSKSKMTQSKWIQLEIVDELNPLRTKIHSLESIDFMWAFAFVTWAIKRDPIVIQNGKYLPKTKEIFIWRSFTIYRGIRCRNWCTNKPWIRFKHTHPLRGGRCYLWKHTETERVYRCVFAVRRFCQNEQRRREKSNYGIEMNSNCFVYYGTRGIRLLYIRDFCIKL